MITKIGLYPIVGDILHSGHIMAIKEARKNCDYLVVALNCRPEGKDPIQSVFERYIQIQAVKYVDEIIVYEGMEDLRLIAESYDYDIRFLGEDYIGKSWDGKQEEKETGKRPYFLKRRHSLSSTELKGRIRDGDS